MSNVPMTLKQDIYRRYMSDEYKSVAALAEEYRLPVDTLKNWIYGYKGADGWKVQKEQFQQEEIHSAVQAGSKELADAWKTGADVYMKWLGLVEKGIDERAFSPKELVQLGKTIPDGLKVLHPMLRLEMNKSTTNIAVRAEEEKKDVLDVEVADDVFNI